MWFYFFPHCIYHLTRWFPKNNRIKFRIVAFLLCIALIVPQLVVLAQPKTSRSCDLPLLNILVASTVFVFVSVGFTLLFSVMDPIPRIVVILFHVFGLGSFILGLITAVYSFQALPCMDSTPELYYWCYVSSILSLITSGYFLLTIPFWLMNHFKPHSVLNWRKRNGLCYEPVMCCACIWHIE